MSLVALMLAGAVAGAPPAPVPVGPNGLPPDRNLQKVLPMPNLYRQPARCGPAGQELEKKIRTALEGRRKAATYAVMRTFDGCGLPAPVGYHQDYLLPGDADPFSQPPAKP